MLLAYCKINKSAITLIWLLKFCDNYNIHLFFILTRRNIITSSKMSRTHLHGGRYFFPHSKNFHPSNMSIDWLYRYFWFLLNFYYFFFFFLKIMKANCLMLPCMTFTPINTVVRITFIFTRRKFHICEYIDIRITIVYKFNYNIFSFYKFFF